MGIKLTIKTTFLLFCSVALCSCKHTGHSTTDKKYRLAIQKSSSKYHYTLTNETSSNFEVEGKELENKNTSEIGLIYNILSADSNGNTAVKITFDKFRLSLKNQDNEQELDADNAANSIDPVEQFLGKIKGTSIEAMINRNGEVSSVNETKSFTDSLLRSLDIPDERMRDQLKEQLSQLVGEGFIKNNLDNFHLFPDTAVYIGDSWTKKNTTTASNIKLNGVTKYTLVSVSDGIANIEAATNISSTNNDDKTNSNVTADLKGTQEGQFELDTQTGLLVSGKSSTSVKGSLQVLGKEIPVTIKLIRKVTGKKL